MLFLNDILKTLKQEEDVKEEDGYGTLHSTSIQSSTYQEARFVKVTNVFNASNIMVGENGYYFPR